jgi:hypothetical protein
MKRMIFFGRVWIGVFSGFPMYPELYKCNSRESIFVEFCIDGINSYVENSFIDSLGLGRDSNPDPSALTPSECTTLLKGLFKTIHPINLEISLILNHIFR